MGLIRQEIGHHHVGAVCRKSLSNGTADATRCAGYQSHFAL